MEKDDMSATALDVKTVEASPEWAAWVSPERQLSQAQKFLAAAGLEGDLRKYPWEEEFPELRQLDAHCARVFPDMQTAMGAANADIADQCICLIGVLFSGQTGARWVAYEWFGREHSFYDQANPMLEYPFTPEGDTAWALMKDVVDNGFSSVAGLLREYTDRHDFDV